MSVTRRRPVEYCFSPARGRTPVLPFKVFIGYADVPAVRCATETIADAIRSTGHRFALQPMLWTFAQLSTSHWRDRSVQAARQADIVVLTNSQPGALSSEIEAWIQLLLTANRGRSTTLVAISGTDDAWTITIEASHPPTPSRGSMTDSGNPKELELAGVD